MRIREICKMTGYFLFCFSALVAVAVLVSVYFDFFVTFDEHPYPKSAQAFIITLIVSLSLGAVFRLIGRGASELFHRKESILVVAFIWVFASLISALPFYITKTFDHPLDCWFESVSGLTTTGASVSYPKKYGPDGQELPYSYIYNNCPEKEYLYYGTLNRVWDEKNKTWLTGFKAVAKPILFWRSLIQWVGGVGIIFVFIALFPALSMGGKFLFEAESIDPSPDTIKPRVKETARFLWIIYCGMSAILIVLLMATNDRIGFFDALLTTFSTVSTGGFSIHGNSIAGYDSAATDWIIIVFMLFGAFNFALFFHLVRGNFKRLLDQELFVFLAGVVIVTILVAFKLWSYAPGDFRGSLFQVVSAMTGTGFYTQNYTLWPMPCQDLLILAMYIGGMTGSTSGGIKSARHLILFRSFRERLEKLFRPEAVHTIRIGRSEVTQETLFNTFNFFWTMVVIAILGMVLLILDNVDVFTTVSVIGAAINNSGLGFRAAGPDGSFAILSYFSRVVAIIWMLLGRLEFFAFLVLLVPSFWRSR